MTGYGTVASHLGMPDAGIASYTDMVGRVQMISNVVNTPFIADGDTGYGGLLNMQHTIRGYELAGAAGIQIEDQEFPKKYYKDFLEFTDLSDREFNIIADNWRNKKFWNKLKNKWHLSPNIL